MKLAHVAQFLTLALMLVTAYLAYQAQREAASANARMSKLERSSQAASLPAMAPVDAMPALVTPVAGMAAGTPPTTTVAPTATPPATPDKFTMPPLPKPLPTVVAEAPKPAATEPAPAGSPAPATTPSLTPLQKLVKNAPTLGKVKQAVADQGFVVLDVGTKQGLKAGLSFDLRRDAAVVAHVVISESLDEEECIANVEAKSVPAGVTVQPGDEVIATVAKP